MTISYLNSFASTQNTSVLDVTTVLPGSLVPNDMLIAIHVYATTGGTETPPSGWTLVGQRDDTTNALSTRVYKRKVTSSGESGATLTWSNTVANRHSVTGVAYRDVDDVVGSASLDESASTVSHDPPSVTFTGTAMILTMMAERGTGGSTTATEPTGYTKRVEFAAVGTGQTFSAIAEKTGSAATPVASPQDPGVWTAALANNNAATWTLALSEDTAPPAPTMQGSFLGFFS